MRLKPLLLFLGGWLGMHSANAQTLLRQESFETNGEGTRYTSTTFDRRTETPTPYIAQYFLREDNPVQSSAGTQTFGSTTSPTVIGNVTGTAPTVPATPVPGSYPAGTFFWASEGAAGQVEITPVPRRPGQTVTLNSVSIAGYTALQVQVAFADARGPGAPLAAPQWENNDYIRVQVRINSTGSWITIGQFVGDNPGGAAAGNLRRDTNLDGVSSAAEGGAVLTSTLTDFTFNYTGSGTTLEARVEVDQYEGTEELAFDNIRVIGTQSATAAPVLAGIESTNLTYNEGDPATFITTSLTVSDSDSPNMTGATVSISTGFVPAQDQLLFTNQGTIIGSGSGTGTITLSGSASKADYQAALRSVRYQNIETVNATGGTRLVTFLVSDGTNTSNTQSRSIDFTTQLNAPASLASPYIEEFATNGEGTRYASNTWSTVGAPCFGFLRVATNPYACSPTTFVNVSGSEYWYSEGTSTANNPNPIDIGTLVLAPVNATNYNNLHFNIRLGTGQSAQWENDDHVKFFYRVNGGSWVLFGAFYGNAPAPGGELQRDADLNGVADGVILNSTLQNIDFALPPAVTGAAVDFMIEVSNDGQEELAFDRIQISGTLVLVVPTVTTAAATSTTINSSVLGGSVTDGGGATVTTRGVVYSSTNTTPTVGGSGVTLNDNGTGIGVFSETITPLTPGTTYYARAYATNSVGTSYGAVITFTTSAVTVSPATLPGGTVAAAYSQTITASGGNAPYSYTITAGALPAGLTLASNGTLSGTPTAGGSFSFTVRATDASAAPGPYNGSQAYTLTISAPTISLSPATLPSGTVAAAYSQTITASGGTAPYNYAITAGALPAGLTLSSAGVLSGTPTAGGSFTFTVRATDASTGSGPYNGSRSYTLTISAPTVALSPATLPNGATGTAYSQTVTASGGTAPYSYAITAGALPAGLTLSSSGSLSGMPTAGGSFTFTVTATDASTGSGPYSGSRAYTVTIVNNNTTVSSVTRLTPSPTATAQVSYRVVFAASVTGVTTSNFAVTPLTGSITGASVSSVNGSGTTYTVVVNTGIGNGTLRLDVANSTGISPSVSNTPYTAGEVYTITKSFAAAPQLTIVGTGGTGSDVTAFVDVVQVLSGGSGFANGLQNNSFETHGTLPNTNGSGRYGYNPTGASWTFNSTSGIAETGSDFTPTTPIPNGIAVAFVQSNGGGNGQLQQNLAVPTGTSYQVRFQAAQRVCCTTLDQSLNVFLNGVFIGTIQPSNSSYSTFTSATFAVTAPALTATVSTTSASPTSTSPIPYSVSFSQSVGTSFAASDVTVTGGTVNAASFSGSGSGPYTFTVTPTGAGTVTVSLAGGVAFDANNTLNAASNSVGVQYQAPTLSISPATLPGGTVATAYSQTITASGGTAPYTYAITAGALPAGLTLTSAGVLSGTPTVGGSFSFTITSTDASPAPGPFSGSRSYTLTIGAPTITVGPATVPGGTVAVAYSQTITASGGTAPYTYAITAGALPAGLTLSSAGTLSGTPTAGGTFTFTLTATDGSTGTGAPYSGSRAYTLTTAAPTITVTPATLPAGTVAAAYSQTISASGGTAPYSYAVTAGALPAGLTLSATGVLSGTPTANGSFTFTITATDASTGSGPYSGSRSYTVTIAVPATIAWTGAASTDWFDANNWNPAVVPTAASDATIPNGTVRSPLIGSNAQTAAIRSLTLNAGATLNMTANTLDVQGNLTNNGTIAATGGTVVLGGGALSNVLGSSNTRFWNLTVGNSGAQSSTSASTSVQRLLTLNGNFATQGNPFTLESNATGTALVVNNSTNVISGNVTVQRYILPDLNAGAGYRHYSAPVSTATVANLATGSFSPIVNPAYNTSATPYATAPFPNVYGYDQSRLATATNNLPVFDKGWFSPGALSNALSVGVGYTVNLAANQSVSVTGPQNNAASTAISLTLSRNSGSTAADAGWALVGNPFPSPLNYSLVAAADRVGLDAAVYTSASTGQYVGNYRSYVNGVGGDPIMAQGQGFFARVSPGLTSGTLNFRNSQRVTAYQNPVFHRTAETRPLVQLTLRSTSGTLSDDAYVYFENGSTETFDSEFDAVKLPNTTGLNLSSSTSREQLSIDGRPALGTTQRIVPLAVGVPTPGAYSFNTAQLLNLNTVPVYLRDLQTGAVINLALQPTYQFTVANATALITNRFELVFSPRQALATASAALAQQVGLYPNPAKTSTLLELPASLGRQAMTATLVDAVGREVRTITLPAQGAVAHQLDLLGLPSGVYALRLNTSAGMIVKKLVVE